MIPRLIVGVISYIIGYLSMGTDLMAFSMGMMVMGLYLTISALFIHLFGE